MCLIVYLPAGQRMTLEQVLDTQEYNPDGIGVMFLGPENRPVTFKSLHAKGNDVLKLINRRVPSDVDYAVHFRRMTRWAKTLGNLHPFPLGKWGAVMHNGTLKYNVVGSVQADKGESDTLIFARDFLSKMPPEALESEGVQRLISLALDTDRLLTLSPGGFLRFNPKKWFDNADGWQMSNDYAMKKHTIWGLPAKPVQTQSRHHWHGYGADGEWEGYGGMGVYRPPAPAPAPAPLVPLPTVRHDLYGYQDGHVVNDTLASSPLSATYSMSIPGFVPKLRTGTKTADDFANSDLFAPAVAWMDYWRLKAPSFALRDYVAPSTILLFALCYRAGPYLMTIAEFKNPPNDTGLAKIQANAKRYMELEGKFTSRWAFAVHGGLSGLILQHGMKPITATEE